ncbi:hypothetical protein BDQ12DRAFT_704709 [Crucibulum laeve]|uniref:Pericentrin/AKAP-450 centrosomal targeting domain-containing protein n=1 Tax=Crucibulum laeve TaxID=68775 RepID=A0A5C3M7D3_9AGAR|nr:hypothetical protein BDQ12DRAFT_704709 [Crucibulum laeve]
MAVMLETPSRIWRRIEAIEDQDMPSLPSLPPFDDSGEIERMSSDMLHDSDEDILEEDLQSIASPIHSTPAASTHHTMASTIRATSSTSSTARFASSIASRSAKSSVGPSPSQRMSFRRSERDSFDISKIPSLPNILPEQVTGHYSDDTDEHESEASVPDVYLPPPDDEYKEEAEGREYSLTDALQSISRSSSPPNFSLDAFENDGTPKKYDYSVSLKSEPKASPFDKYRNVALRKTIARARTPSLSRTTSSQASSPTNSTPRSNRSIAFPHSSAASPISALSIPLPRSRTASPAIVVHRPEDDISLPEPGHTTQETDVRSMDITDVHISPPRFEDDQQTDEEQHSEQELSHTSGERDGVEGSLIDELEPTFSSEGDSTPYEHKQSAHNSLAGPSSAFSSPAQSIAFTPTPAFPRPRTRFALPPPPEDLLTTPIPRQGEDHEQEAEEVLLTPHTRRRSFLLSVINSTARPRLKFPTPHPRNVQVTPSTVASTPAPSVDITGTNLQTAFAGVTPRPRLPAALRRQSHHLTQTYVPSPGTSESEAAGAGGAAWATTGSGGSPYDGAADRASFISTASSHDLTTHQRANTSFDPAMGFGAGATGHGVGRFNAGKLNNYLHGLNRRLQEENEVLLERLKRLEEVKKMDGLMEPAGAGAGAGSNRRQSGVSRRLSAGPVLGNVQEDMAEGWLEEKADLEEMVETLKEQADKFIEEKDELEKYLEKEKEERERDKDRWKERMVEVEQGVSGIIAGLEKKLEAAEKRATEAGQRDNEHIRDLEKQLLELRGERDTALERADKAERVLESGKELGGALREANERAAHVIGDLRNANAQMKELEEEVMRSDARIDDLEKDLQEAKDIIAGLEEELNTNSDALASERAIIHQLEAEAREDGEELQATKAYVAELEEGAEIALEKIDNLEQELASAQESVKQLTLAEEAANQRVKQLEDDADKAHQLVQQVEEALDEAEQKMLADEEVVAELQTKVLSLERERERLLERSASKNISRNPLDAGPTEAEFEALEDELDNANREIARLSTLLNQSPAWKAMEKAKDTKIEMLEKEREELLERNKALRLTMTEFHTPSKIVNASGISPIHRQVLSMSIRGPKTPGGPLRDMSWLNNTSMDPSLTPLVTEINRLQRELDLANESIDDKIDKLEDAGLGVVGLTRKLEDAREKIVALEDEIARLTRKEERHLRRLERTRCQKCNIKVDLQQLTRGDESSCEISRDNLATEPPTPPTRTTEALRADLHTVNSHLEGLRKQWEDEKRKLLGEKAVLQDTASRLNGQVKTAKEEAKKIVESERAGGKLRSNIEGELEKARHTITELEEDLKAERSRLRALTTEQSRAQREKTDILAQLKRTESDMDDVRQQLLRFKQDNHELEKELRENVNAEQKARLLETRVAENIETIEQLRQERSLLATDHKILQQRFSEVSESVNRLRGEYAAHSTSHDNHRHKLDLQLLEIEDLRRALNDQASELQRTEMEKDRISAEKSNVAKTIALLEADLKRVRRDAEAFGRDLKLLRAEKEKAETKHKEELTKAERTKKQAQTQIRLLAEQLEIQKAKTLCAKDDMKNHVCAVDENQTSALKLQHNRECKGLMVQIRYLKCKFTRETSFRNDLGYQKKYLLALLWQFEKSERTIFASIARIGFPVALPPEKKTKKLKSVAIIVVFLNRVQRASELWREQSASKQAVLAALEDVRRKRAAGV